MRANSTFQGYLKFSDDVYFTSLSMSATGYLVDFNNIKLGAGGFVEPRLGFCSDTTTSNITVTEITDNTVRYTTTAAGLQRVWCPDRGEPFDVVGATWTWNDVDQVVNLSTLGPDADAVTIYWYTGGGGGLSDAANLIISLLPLFVVLMAVGAWKSPDYRAEFIAMVLIAGTLLVIANLMYAWGA